MIRRGVHEDVVVSRGDLDDTSEPRGVGSVTQVADEIGLLCERLEALSGELAVLVRDGSGTDTAVGAAARDAMAAAGRLAGVSTVISAVAYCRMDETNASFDDGVRDTGFWAQRHGGFSASETALCRRITRCLADYPQIAEAFLAGDLRGHHLAAIDRIIPGRFAGSTRDTAVETISAVQGELIQAAVLCETDARYRRFCASIRDRLDIDGPQPRVSEDSEVRLAELGNGRWSLWGDLSADHGAVIASLLDDEIRRAHDNNRDNKDGNGADTRDERVPQCVRRAEVLRELLMRGAATNKAGRVGLFVHLDLADLEARGGVVPETPVARTEAGYDVSDDTLWALLADADVIPVVNLDGTPLSYGRTRRLAPDILRHILAHRDQTCGFPGCDSPPIWLDQHHVIGWIEGGVTDPTNIRGTCRFHHHLHHDHNWDLDPPDPDDPSAPGDYRVTRPDGSPFDPTPRWRARQTPRQHRHDPYRQHILQRLNTLKN